MSRICASGGTAYTTDLKSVGESLRVQIPPRAPATKQVALPSFYDAFPPLKRHSFFGHTPLKWFYNFSNYMKIYISYFYQIRHFSQNMIPISTAIWDPKWFHDFTYDQDYIFKDKRGIYNGIRAEIFLMPEDYQCECGPNCLTHNPQICNFLQDYKAHLDTLDFDYVISELERIANKIQEIEQFKDEPIIVLIVYETPKNPCSERQPLIEWFMAHGLLIEEWSKKICP